MPSCQFGVDSSDAASRGSLVAVPVERITAVGSRAGSGCATTGDAYRLPYARRPRLRHDCGNGWHGHAWHDHGWAGLRRGISRTWLPLQPLLSSHPLRFRYRPIAPRGQRGFGTHVLSPAKNNLGLSSGAHLQQQHSSRAAIIPLLSAVPRLGRNRSSPRAFRSKVIPAVG